MWMAVILGVLSFSGIEIIAVTSGETEDPTTAIPAALRTMAIRLFLFYVLALTVVIAIIPWTQSGGSVQISQSPFVKILGLTGIPGAAGIMNFVIVSAALSSMNTDLYLCSRMLFSLARGGYAPKLMGTLNSRGAPMAATLASGVCILLAASVSTLTPKAYAYLQGIALFGAIIVWMIILFSHFGFRRAHRAADLPVRMPFFPVMQIAGLILLAALLVTMALDKDWNMSWIVGWPWLAVLTIAYFVVRRRLRQVGVTAALRLPDAADVEAARANIAGIARRTPLWRLDVDLPGREIWLKLETLQPLGSFKIRAGVNAMKALDPADLAEGVLGASAGNFGQGLAFAARTLGVPVTIVAPDGAAETKIDALRALGAAVIRVPFAEWWRTLTTRSFPGVSGAFVHPVAENAVVAGNATIGAEIVEDLAAVRHRDRAVRRRRPRLRRRLCPAPAPSRGKDAAGGERGVRPRRRRLRRRRPGDGGASPELRRRHGQQHGAAGDVAADPRDGGRRGFGHPAGDRRRDTAAGRDTARHRRGRGRRLRRRGPLGSRRRGPDRVHRFGRQHRRGRALRHPLRREPGLQGRGVSSGADLRRIVFGCGNFGGLGSSPSLRDKGDDEFRAFEILDRAREIGLTRFDTANTYGGGVSETILGAWLARQGAAFRASIEVATKVGNPYGCPPGDHPLSAQQIAHHLDESLRRLRLERIDLYYVHEFEAVTPLEETLEAMGRAHAAGKIAAFGVSNASADQLRAVLKLTGGPLRSAFTTVQNGFNLLEMRDLPEVIPLCRAEGLDYVAFSPLAGGLLTGKYRRDATPESGRLNDAPAFFDHLMTEDAFATIDRLRSVAEAAGQTVAQAALEATLATPGVSAVIVAPRTRAQFDAYGL